MTDQTDIKLTSTRQIKHSTPTNDSYYRKIATNTSTSSTPVRQTHKIDSKVSLPSKVFDFIGLNDTPNRKYSKEYLLAQFDDKFLIPTGSTILDAIAVRQRNPNPNLIPLQSYVIIIFDYNPFIHRIQVPLLKKKFSSHLFRFNWFNMTKRKALIYGIPLKLVQGLVGSIQEGFLVT